MANDIKKHPVPLIFKKILKDRLSGVLQVTAGNFQKELFFINAQLAFSVTNLENERLGEILRSAGKITAEQLGEALLIKKKVGSKYKIGEILVKKKILSMRDVYAALVAQVKGIAASTFQLTEGQWRFTVQSPHIPGNQNLKIRLPDAIRQGVEHLRDFSYFERKFLHRCPVTTTLGDSTVKYLNPDDIAFYNRLGEFANIPLEKTISEIRVAEQRFWKNTILMYLLNKLDFVEFTVEEQPNENAEEINDLYSRVNTEQVDYYDLLDIAPSASPEEIKKRYFDFSKKFHPDRINAAPDSTVMVRANAVLAEVNKAYEVLSSKEKKTDYDNAGHRPKEQPPVDKASQQRKAKDLYFKANKLFKLKQYSEAAALMEEAVRIDDNRANFYLLLGLIQSKIPAFKKKAEEHLKKAAQLEPWNADPLFALGELYRSERLVKKAEAYYKKALEMNMEHTLAGKAIKDLGGLFGKKKSAFPFFGKKK
jgi:curved DNA-binding protein CbpA